MTRRFFIAGNWKLYKTLNESADLAQAVVDASLELSSIDLCIAPVFTVLSTVCEVVNESSILLSSQDIFWSNQGAFTGEVGADHLKEVGCSHAIVGHSERRHVMMEPDAWITKKTEAAIKNGIVPIVCVGEKIEERDAGQTLEVIERQLRAVFSVLPKNDAGAFVIAYEPVWAIGTGRVAKASDAEAVHLAIRELFAQEGFAEGEVRILYGGSVKPDNADELLRQTNIDGLLIGGASLEASSYLSIARIAEKIAASGEK